MAELDDLRATLKRLANSHPGDVIFAWLEVLTAAMVTNLALLDWQRQRIYRAIVDQLASKGIR